MTRCASCRPRVAAAAGVVTLALGMTAAGCDDDGSATGPGPARTDVVVAFDSDGAGPEPMRRTRLRCPDEARRSACQALLAAPHATFLDVPPRRACTQIYGGPQRGVIDGVVDGRPVDAELSRANGCEIARWEALDAVLAVARDEGA